MSNNLSRQHVSGNETDREYKTFSNNPQYERSHERSTQIDTKKIFLHKTVVHHFEVRKGESPQIILKCKTYGWQIDVHPKNQKL